MTLFLIGFLPSYPFMANNGYCNSKKSNSGTGSHATISGY